MSAAITNVQWIKMRRALSTDPKVIHMARALIRNPMFCQCLGSDGPSRCDVTCDGTASHPVTVCDAHSLRIVKLAVVGALVAVWSSALESISPSMVMRHADLETIDMIADVPGFGQAMAGVGWIEVLPNGQGLLFPNFDEHNTMSQERSSGAKTTAERTRAYRQRKARAETSERHVTCDVTRDHRAEKKRVENKIPPSPPDGGDDARADPAEHKKAEAICNLLTAKGMIGAHPGQPTLRAYIKQGVTIEQFEAAAEKTLRKSQRMNYLFEVLKGLLKEAQGIKAGPSPFNGPWDRGRTSIEATAALHGLAPWDQQASQLGRGESFFTYTDRVRKLEEANPKASAGILARLH